MANSKRSEDVYGQKIDRCMYNALVKLVGGVAVGIVFSATLFKRKPWPVLMGGSLGTGMGISDCNHEFQGARYMKGKPWFSFRNAGTMLKDEKGAPGGKGGESEPCCKSPLINRAAGKEEKIREKPRGIINCHRDDSTEGSCGRSESPRKSRKSCDKGKGDGGSKRSCDKSESPKKSCEKSPSEPKCDAKAFLSSKHSYDEERKKPFPFKSKCGGEPEAPVCERGCRDSEPSPCDRSCRK